MIHAIIDRLQAAFPINRVVTLLLPFYAATAGAWCAYMAEHLPYLSGLFTEDQLTGVFVAVTATALAAGYKWLDGWQAHEQSLRDTDDIKLNEPSPGEAGDV